MIKSGIVMEIQSDKLCLMTNSGEFVKIKFKGERPELGQIYTGEEEVKMPFYRFPVIAASIAIMMFCSTMAYAYYTPVASIRVKINPYVELKINRFARIIKVIPLNKDGTVLISSLNLKNKTLENGLHMLMDEATKENFINKEYKKNHKEINITITDKKSDQQVDVSGFVNYAAENNIKVNVKTTDKNEAKSEYENATDSNLTENDDLQTDQQNTILPSNNKNNSNKNTQDSRSNVDNGSKDDNNKDSNSKENGNKQKDSKESNNSNKPKATYSNSDKTNKDSSIDDSSMKGANSSLDKTNKENSTDFNGESSNKTNANSPDSIKSDSEKINQSPEDKSKPTSTPTIEANHDSEANQTPENNATNPDSTDNGN